MLWLSLKEQGGLVQADESLRTRPQPETGRPGGFWEPSRRGRQSILVSLSWQTAQERRTGCQQISEGQGERWLRRWSK